MESTDSSTSSQQPHLPPGFRFHPTDEELVVHYLKKKAASIPLPIAIIAEVDLYKFDPWELPAKASFGEQEWYFFSPRDRKYPNGARPNRAATSGYWKATGTDKPVLTSGGTQKVGVKKALVFYGGKPPKGEKTNWIMHEYRLAENKNSTKPPGCDLAGKKGSLRLDDWVLCRIYKKSSTHRAMDHETGNDNTMNDIIGSIQPQTTVGQLNPKLEGIKGSSYGNVLENNQTTFGATLGSIDGNTNLLPLKRTLPNMYWNEEGQIGNPPPLYVKRFTSENGSDTSGAGRGDENGSIASLLSQQQEVLGSLGDGLYRQPYHLPGMNWYS